MKNKEYWEERFTGLESSLNQYGQDTFRKIEPAFDKAQRQIESEINMWVTRVANNNKVSMVEARKMLNAKELKEFQWDVKQFVQYGHDNALSTGWMKELENASARFHVSRLEALKVRTQQALEVAFGNELDEVDMLSRRTFTDGYYHSCYEIQKGLNIGWDIGQINDKQLEKIISKPWAADGQNFSSRIWNSKTKMTNELHTELVRTCILGKAPDDAIRNMTRFVDKKFDNAKSAAGRLVMTEQAFFASAAQKEAFNGLDVEEFEVVATLDSRTSEICQQMDGQHFPMKDFNPGVTAPPFHPWCRSCTVPFFDDEWSQGERAAKGEEGNTYYVPESMKYPEWKKSFVDGGSKDDLQPLNKSSIIKKKKVDKVKLDTSMFPAEFNSKTEIKNTKLMCDYVNNLEDADPDVLQLYSKMGQMESVTSMGASFKISHASGCSVSVARNYMGDLAEVKLTIPKLSGDNLAGQINTTLHENMHLIDLYLRDKSNDTWFSRTNRALKNTINDIQFDIKRNIVRENDYGISNELKTLFKKNATECDAIKQIKLDDFNKNHDVIVNKYKNKEITYDSYKKQYNKLKKELLETIDYEQRNALGGGIGNLEDIYDALSQGSYRDNGVVTFGHGSSYYSISDKVPSEIIANYASLSITRPDLIELLRKDKPSLVNALEETIQAMLKEVE